MNVARANSIPDSEPVHTPGERLLGGVLLGGVVATAVALYVGFHKHKSNPNTPKNVPTDTQPSLSSEGSPASGSNFLEANGLEINN